MIIIIINSNISNIIIFAIVILNFIILFRFFTLKSNIQPLVLYVATVLLLLFLEEEDLLFEKTYCCYYCYYYYYIYFYYYCYHYHGR